MAENGKIGFDDLFNFGDSAEVQKAIKTIQQLGSEYEKLQKHLADDAKQISAALKSTATALQQQEAQLKTLNVTNSKSQKEITALATAIEKTAGAHAKNKQTLEGVNASQKIYSDSLTGIKTRLTALNKELANTNKHTNPQQWQRLAKEVGILNAQATKLKDTAKQLGNSLTTAKGSYNGLVAENKKLTTELKNMSNAMNGTNPRARQLQEQIRRNTEAMKRFDAAMGQSYRNVGNYAANILAVRQNLEGQRRTLIQQLAALRQQQSATKSAASTQNILQREIRETQRELSRVNAQLETYGVKTRKHSLSLNGLGSSLRKASLEHIAMYASFTAILMALDVATGKVIRTNIEMSDSQADVRKTTQMTRQEVSELTKALAKLDTRTPLKELLEIGRIGGQAGIAASGIESFVKAIDKANVALSDEFSGGAEEISKVISKLNNVYKVSNLTGLEDGLLRIANAVNVIGAETIATGPYVTDFALRVGAAARNAGLALPNVLAFGAALEAVGQTDEVAGTAFNQLLTELASDPEKFFPIAKLSETVTSLEGFVDLINSDVNQALILFLEGLRISGGETTEFAKILASLDVDGERAKSVITSLANELVRIKDYQELVNDAMGKTSSIMHEFEVKNDNLAGAVAKLGAAISNTLVSDAFQNFLLNVIDMLMVFGATIKAVYRGLRDNRDIITAAAFAFLGFKTKVAVTALSFSSLGTALNITKVAILANVRAMWAWVAAAAAANPITAIVTAAAGLTIVYKRLEKNSDRNLAVQKKVNEVNKHAKQAVKELSEEYQQLVSDLEIYHKLSDKEQDKTRQEIELGILKRKQVVEDLLKEKQLAKLEAAKIDNFDKINAWTKTYARTHGQSAVAILKYEQYLREAIDERTNAVEKSTNRNINNAIREYNNFRKLKAKAAALEIEDRLRARLAEKAAEKHSAELDLLIRQQQRELEKQKLENINAALDRFVEKKQEARALDGANARKAADEQADAELRNNKIVLDRFKILNADKKKIASDSAKQMQEIAYKQLTEELKALDGKYEATLKGEKMLGVNRMKITQEYLAGIEDIMKRYDAIIAGAGDGGDPVIEAARRAATNRIRILALEREDALALLEKEAIELREQAEKEGADTVKADKLVALKRLQIDRDFVQKKKEILNELSDKITFPVLEINTSVPIDFDRTLEGMSDGLKKLDKDLDETGRKLEDFFDTQADLMRQAHEEFNAEVIRTIGITGDAMFQVDLEQRQAQMDAVQKQSEDSLKAVEDNEAAKLRIQHKADKEMHKLRVRQAKADKNRALFDIGINTAMAILRIQTTYAGFPPAGFPLIALIIAQAAAAAAAVMARPLPLYAKGRKGGPAEWAIVDEKGPEIIQRKDGLYLGKNKGARVTYLNKGDKVFTANETQHILKQIEFNKENRSIGSSFERGQKQLDTILLPRYGQVKTDDGGEVKLAIKSLEKTIKKKKELHLNITKKGVEVMAKQGSQWTKYVDGRYKN